MKSENQSLDRLCSQEDVLIELEKIEQYVKQCDDEDLLKRIYDFKEFLKLSEPSYLMVVNALFIGMKTKTAHVNRMVPIDSNYELLKLRSEKLNREKGLNDKLRISRHLKEWATDEAKELWGEDVGENIRLGDMCKRVRCALYHQLTACLDMNPEQEQTRQDLLNALPKNAEKLKPWLRHVAPDYAKAKGRPKKI